MNHTARRWQGTSASRWQAAGARRWRRWGIGGCLAIAAAAPAAVAQTDFPSRPVTLVVPFPPGGTTEGLARARRAAAARDRPAVLPDCFTPDADIYAVYPPHHGLAAVRVSAFVDFLAASFAGRHAADRRT